ncbi:MAG: hypothetical protein P4L40_08575 [Terracidiphilus sp.]|nr:hypothetical protein [Terracidiphilus sp.]
MLPAVVMVIVTYCVALTDSPFLSPFHWNHFAPVAIAHHDAVNAHRAVVRAQVCVCVCVCE